MGRTHASSLVTYLLDQQRQDREGPKGFENRLSHLLKDMDLLMATSPPPPHVKLPVVTYMYQDSDTVCEEASDQGDGRQGVTEGAEHPCGCQCG